MGSPRPAPLLLGLIVVALTLLGVSASAAETPVLVKDINPGPENSIPKELTDVGGTLLFSPGAFLGAFGGQLWKSDGTEAGTVQVKVDVVHPDPEFTEVAGTLFFKGVDPNGGELWKSDGTEAGTVLVKDLNPGPNSSAPEELTAVGGDPLSSSRSASRRSSGRATAPTPAPCA